MAEAATPAREDAHGSACENLKDRTRVRFPAVLGAMGLQE